MPVRPTANEPSRISSAQSLRAGVAWAIALMVLALGGCHGGAQTDVVEREMRWQEDQIYAMEDYLTEYQQLLCQYRSENSALKRQLSQGGRRQQGGPTLRQRPDSRVRRDEQEIQDTKEIIRELTPPPVPPLMETLPGGVAPPASQSNDPGPSLNFRPARRQTPGVNRTVLEESTEYAQVEPKVLPIDPPDAAQTIDLEEAFAAEEDADTFQAEETFAEDESTADMELLGFAVVSGDVLPAEGEGGPRLLVSVEPLGASGLPAAFDGELSLMILDVAGETPRGVARWDFSSEHLAELLDSGSEQSMQFPLQLPADTPTDGQLEIWARLMPVDGEKVLAHAELDLAAPSSFSSEQPQVVVVEEPAVESQPVEEIAEEPLVVAESDNLSVGEWNGWQVAQPGQRNKAAASQQPPSAWRKATQPLPTKLNHGRPVVATTEALEPAAGEHVARREKPAAVQPPTWSSERGNSAVEPAAKLAPRAWTPER